MVLQGRVCHTHVRVPGEVQARIPKVATSGKAKVVVHADHSARIRRHFYHQQSASYAKKRLWNSAALAPNEDGAIKAAAGLQNALVSIFIGWSIDLILLLLPNKAATATEIPSKQVDEQPQSCSFVIPAALWSPQVHLCLFC